MHRAITHYTRILTRRYCISRYNELTNNNFFCAQGVQISNDNRIYIHELGSEAYLVRIGNDCTIAPEVVRITHDRGLSCGKMPIATIAKSPEYFAELRDCTRYTALIQDRWTRDMTILPARLQRVLQ